MGEIIELALKKGADAIHPGAYGFLSEKPEFARKCHGGAGAHIYRTFGLYPGKT